MGVWLDRVTEVEHLSGDSDRTLGFTLPDNHARGRVVRIGPLLDAILANHSYPPIIEKLLGEALVLTTLLGALLKGDGGQLTMQAQTEAGAIGLLVCDYKDGAVRGYVQFDADKLAMVPVHPTLFGLFGKGYLAITFDQSASGERYQGIVPLEGESLADAVQSYFVQSEQIPCLVTIAIGEDCRLAGGLLLQHLPEGEQGRDRIHTRLDHPEWDHIRALAETVGGAELLDPALPLETLVWRLFHAEPEVRVLGGAALTKGCRCDLVHIRDVIARFPAEERREMADNSGDIVVDCAFCARKFPIPLTDFEN
jgi:molecular chaperone Hsp33